MGLFFEDLRYAVRSFARRPGFTAVILLTLGLGIGSNVAIFSVANAVLFRQLPYEAPEELVLVWNRLPATNVARSLISGPDFLDYRNETTLFEGFAGAFALKGTITGEGPPEEIMAAWTSENMFGILGVTPALGRDFTLEDAAPIDFEDFTNPNAELAPGAVILTDGFWRRRFGGDPSVVGRTIEMDGLGSVVIGVLPADFRIYLPADAGMPTNIDAWRVIPSNFAENARDAAWLTVVTRLKDGVPLERAQEEMDALSQRLREQYQHHANTNMQIVLAGMHRDVVNHARPVLLSLLGVVGFVLLIACSNVANLLLVRAASRGREIAVRAALGGGKGQIIRQMLTESGVLAVGGALLGLLLAWWGVRLLAAMGPDNLPRLEEVAIDGPVLLFTLGAAVASALIFGAVPALKAASPNLANALKERGSDSGGVKGNKVRTALVVSEVALSLVLLIGAGLMVRSFAELRNVEPGFNPESVLTFSTALSFFTYPDPDTRADFMNQLTDRVASLPGVQSVGGVTPLPLGGGDQYSVSSYGLESATEEEWLSNKADYKSVLPGYFETMGIRLVAGRFLERADNEAEALNVAVIDRKLADKIWPGGDPIGKELVAEHFTAEEFGLVRAPMRVVGIVENVRAESLAYEGRETLYVPFRFSPWLPVTFTVRGGAGGLSGLLPQVRQEIAALDPEIPVSTVRFMDSYVSDAMAQTRFLLTLIGIFAAMALLLASLGLYGVISYSVRQRTREIGVRITFGAGDGDILRLILRQGLTLGLMGVGVGLVVAFFGTRVATSLLVGVSATDPLTFVGIPVVLLIVTVAASYIPARRAIRVDPVEALTTE